MKITNCIKALSVAVALSSVTAISQATAKPATEVHCVDTFEREITPKGTSNINVLQAAPNPDITINGTEKKAAIVIDLSKNILYKYDENGTPERAYLISSGKKSTPTHKGIRIVTHKETYPYKTAPSSTKRRKNPKAYGPKIICLNKINPNTGEQSPIGEFIHGTNQPQNLGKYVSHGCIRMDNEVIKQLSEEVKRGDIVIIQ